MDDLLTSPHLIEIQIKIIQQGDERCSVFTNQPGLATQILPYQCCNFKTSHSPFPVRYLL